MIEPIDLATLVARERQSRDMAEEPGDVAVMRAHLIMADSYAVQIAAAASKLR